ncbi:S1C family serine protease [Ideonella sp.]|uniref:S1C family serine protease n=1 Tax=Ideonella sp. TaxID=1929293 RepID=UPI0035B29C8B
MGQPLQSLLAACRWALFGCLLAAGAAHGQAAAAREAAPAELVRASDAVVGVATIAVKNASSSDLLGAVRHGSGTVIGEDGLVLTIGYLVLEADQVLLLPDDGRRVPARVVAYDAATGFGLLQSLVPLKIPAAPLGDAKALADDEPLLVITGGEDAGISVAQRVSQRAFSGYWEYHLDQAVFTAPARMDHGGAALFNLKGELVGVGALFVGDALGPGQPPLHGNMFVPVDLLKPILPELLAHGRSASSRRAWLGLHCAEIGGELRVLRTSSASPAEAAGLLPGDRVVRIDDQAVDRLDTLWRRLWSGGAVERDVVLDIERDGRPLRVPLRSVDRQSVLKQPEGT